MRSGDAMTDRELAATRVGALRLLRAAADWSLPGEVWVQTDKARPSVTRTLDRLAQSLADNNDRALAAAVEDLLFYARQARQIEIRAVHVGSLDATTSATHTDGQAPPPEVRLRINALVLELEVPKAEPGRSGHDR
ncbi:hypothetical protein [Frankia sp. Cas3]|uniref:hypothetical protein n=1 Tax=Frankia sp. Cas3 TaxID=3073926 RepID=UPI002AD20BF6|nr:hypothetical protein [Frankia sp. Cas3]